MKKELLIITSYFPPEIGAASNRIAQLGDGLSHHGFDVTIVTPLPNYPKGRIFKSYRGAIFRKERHNAMTVHRLWLFASNSKNKVLRFFSMISYSMSLSIYILSHKIPNRVIVQSPPLLVAFTSVLLLRRRKRTLILNVSDLWPQAGLDLGAFKENAAYRLLKKIEAYNYKKASIALGQSKEIMDHITAIAPKTPTLLYRNFPKDLPKAKDINLPTEGKLKIVYAGLLGVAQGIFNLIQNLDFNTFELHLYGAGAELDDIQEYLNTHPDLPVFYHGSVPRSQLIEEIGHYHLALIPLLNRIYGSVPSKIFEIAHLGLPLVYFGGGEGEVIVEKHRLGWTVSPGQYKALNTLLSDIKLSDCSIEKRAAIRQTALVYFNFDKQLSEIKNYMA